MKSLSVFRRIMLFAFLVGMSLPSFAATYTVSNTSPTITTPNGLHWAIDQANNNPGVDIIQFSIDGTIDMLTNTFTITEGVIIDGTTAPGYVAGTPSFILSRNGGTFINTGGSPTGLEINGLGFTNQNANQNGSTAMLLSSCTNLTVQNNEFTGIGIAMDVNLGSQVSITDNDFNTCGYANNRYTVEISGLTGTDPATRLVMKDNEFLTCGSGITLDNMDGLAIDPVYAAATTEVHLPDGALEDIANIALAITNSDNITLDDLDISNTSTVSGIGLLITNGNNIIVQNLTINNKATGIQSTNNNSLLIQDNTIDNVLVGNQAGRGISVLGGQDAQILDNTLREYGRANNQYALTIDGVSDNGSGDRLIVNGTTFDGGGSAVVLANMDAMVIDNVNTATPGQGVHLPDADGRQGMYNISLQLNNMDNTTINNFDLSYTGGTVSGSALNTNGCDNLNITNNTIDNRSQGISCTNSNQLLIQDNTIDNVLVANQGGRGISISGGSDVEVLDNTIRQYGRVNNQYALTIDGVVDNGSGDRLVVNGTTFDGGGNSVSLANMDGLIIDNVSTMTPGQGVHLPDADGRQGMYNVNMNLFNIDNTTLNNFNLSYTGGTVSGSALNTNGCDNLNITNNTIDNRSQGIFCLNSSTLLVQNNEIDNVLLANNIGRGIWISGGNDVEVLDNTIRQMGRANNQYALTLNNVVDNGSGQRLIVNGTTFDGGANGVSIENMDGLIIDNVLTATPGQGVHLPDSDGRQGMNGINMNLHNMDNTTLNNFNLSYTGGTVAGSGLNTNACDNLNITNNTIDNRSQGIYCINSSALLVQDNEIDNVLLANSAQRAIWINGGNDIKVLDNTISGYGHGNNIYALTINNVVDNGSGQRIVVNGTTFVGGSDGVSLENMDGVIIDNVASAGQGIHLPDSDGRQAMIGTVMQLSNIDNTTLSNFNLSSTGGLAGQGLRAFNCDVLTIQGFTISDRGTGMYFQNCPSSSILNNTISGGNGNGIEVFQGSNMLVQDNSVSDFTSGNNLAAYKYRNIVDDGMGNRLSALDNSFSNNNKGIFVGSMDDMIISDGSVADSEIILKTADNYGSDINGLEIEACTNTRIENLSYKGDASAVAGTAIHYDLSTTSITTGVSISYKGTGIFYNRNDGHVLQQSLFESNSFGVILSTANVTTNYTVENNNFSCNGEAIRANQYAVVDAANNFWGQNDGSSTDTGSGDSYSVTGNAPNTGVVNNTTTFLTSENTSVPIGGRKIFTSGTVQLTDGQTATSVADSTDYETVNTGTTKTRQFRIVNSGIDSLHISSIVSSDAAFTIANAPAYVLCEDSVAFDVIFAPTAGTTYNSTITVNQEDCYNTNFEFAVAGVGFSTCDISITSATPTDEVCPDADDGIITVVAACGSCNDETTDIRYSIDGSDFTNTTGIFTGLADGTYTVTVRDVNDTDCNATMMNVVVGAGVDSNGPTISCNDITVDLDAAGSYTLTSTDLEALAMGSTDDCTDFSGLTITSTPSSFDCNDVAGQANNLALSFDQTPTGNGSDYVVSSNNVGITGNADRTLEFWIRMDETDVFNETIINWGDIAQGESFGFYQTFNSELEFYTFDSPNGWDHGTGHFFDEQQWYHIAVSYDGSTNLATIYINGDPAPNSTFTPPGTINTTDSPLFLATRTDLNALTFTSIDLDEVRVWDYARTQSEIMADMNVALNGNESGLVLYYDMELDGTGTTNVVDKAGSNNATLINMDPANDWIASGSPVFSGGTPVVLEVTDAAGNTSTSTCAVSVTVNTNLTVASTAVAETCMDNDDGQLTITVTGGTGPYTFTATRQGDGSTLTLSGTSPQTFMNLIADEYIIEVEDNGGCTGTITENVAESMAPCCDISITSATPTDEVCPDADDGTLTVAATCTTCTGGIQYSIDGFTTFNTDGIFTGLADGTYTVDVRDAGDATCNASSSGVVAEGADTTDPVLVGCPTAISLELDLCNELTITAADLGITATDNCGTAAISLSQTMFTGATTVTVTVTATDDATPANISTCNVDVTTTVNPDYFEITTDDEDLGDVCSDETILIDATTLLNGDSASNGSTLEVQEVNLVNAADGTIVDNNDGTWTFTPASGVTGNVALTYIVTVDGEDLYFDGNGHFYEFITDQNIAWTAARDAAELKVLNGVNGYLATVTSQEENDFIETKLQGHGWLGGLEVGSATSGEWRWVTGPEADLEGGLGLQFWDGNVLGNPVGSVFSNWRANEPNDVGANGEQYLHMRNAPAGAEGEWNDYPITGYPGNGAETVAGYIVEYGGVAGCTPNFSATGNITINVLDNDLSLSASVTNEACIGAADGAIDLTIIGGGTNTISWENNANPGVEIATSEDLTGLEAGTYNVTVSDGSCDVTASYGVGLTDNNPCCDIAITDVVTVDEGCPDAADGTLTVTATCISCDNGVSDIRYSIDGSNFMDNGGVFTGLADGTYTVTIRDVNSTDCIAMSAGHVVGAGTDTEVPTITCAANQSFFATPAVCTLDGSLVVLDQPTVSDNCGIAMISNDAPAIYEIGDVMITWTVEDVNGLTNTCMQMVTIQRPFEIQDNGIDDDCDGDTDEAPLLEMIALEAGTTGSCVSNTDCCTDTYCYGLQYTPNLTGTLANYTSAFTTDCTDGNNSVIYNQSCVMTDNSFSASDCAGGNGTFFNSSGNNGSVAITEGVPVIIHQICFDVPANDMIAVIEDEITNITMSVDLNNGPTVTESPSFTSITVSGNTPPTITSGTIDACYSNAADAEAAAIAMTTATDDCSPTVTFSAVTLGSCSTTVRVYATDHCGLVDSVDYNTVIDGDMPIVTGTLDVTEVEACYSSEAPAALTSVTDIEALPGGMTINDDCTDDASLAVTHFDTETGSCPIVINRVYTITDGCGNAINVTHTINVNDTTAPSIVGTLDATTVEGCSETDAPMAATTIAEIEALAGGITVNDGCDDALLSLSHEDFVIPGCMTMINRVYTVTDPCGNMSNIVHSITVTDTTDPVLTAGSVDACYGTEMEAVTATIAATTFTDNCATALTYTTNVTGSCPSTIEVIGEDLCGNTNAVQYTVVINDGNGPTEVGGPAETESTVQTALDVEAVSPPVFEDACNNTLTAVGPVIGGTYQEGDCIGTITYTFTYTDCAGTETDWIYTYNVDCKGVNIKIFLEGAYDAGSITTMYNDNHLLPGQDKTLATSSTVSIFGTQTPFGHPYQGQPWAYTETLGDTYGEASAPGAPSNVTEYPAHVSDWVLVTVRKNGIMPSDNVWRSAAWLHSNGEVTFPECPTMLTINASSTYYVVVEHRNHMAALDTATIDPTGDYISIDFTQSDSYAPIFRFGQKEVAPGVFGLYSGNGHQTGGQGSINSADRTRWRRDQNKIGYFNGDYTLDIISNSADETAWKTNQNKTTGIQF